VVSVRGRTTFTVLFGLSLALPALGQATRETALAALRTATQAGHVDAQLSLAQLLDVDPGQRNQEALSLYERAARAGNRVA
jgi:TPR repeat protein